MNNLPQSITQLYTRLLSSDRNLIYCSDSIYDAIVLSRLQNLSVEDRSNSNISLFFSVKKFEDGRDYYRFLFQIKTSNNSKVHNIESVMQLIQIIETEFITIDKVATCQQDGSYFVDVYKLIQ